MINLFYCDIFVGVMRVLKIIILLCLSLSTFYVITAVVNDFIGDGLALPAANDELMKEFPVLKEIHDALRKENVGSCLWEEEKFGMRLVAWNQAALQGKFCDNQHCRLHKDLTKEGSLALITSKLPIDLEYRMMRKLFLVNIFLNQLIGRDPLSIVEEYCQARGDTAEAAPWACGAGVFNDLIKAYCVRDAYACFLGNRRRVSWGKGVHRVRAAIVNNILSDNGQPIIPGLAGNHYFMYDEDEGSLGFTNEGLATSLGIEDCPGEEFKKLMFTPVVGVKNVQDAQDIRQAMFICTIAWTYNYVDGLFFARHLETPSGFVLADHKGHWHLVHCDHTFFFDSYGPGQNYPRCRLMPDSLELPYFDKPAYHWAINTKKNIWFQDTNGKGPIYVIQADRVFFEDSENAAKRFLRYKLCGQCNATQCFRDAKGQRVDPELVTDAMHKTVDKINRLIRWNDLTRHPEERDRLLERLYGSRRARFLIDSDDEIYDHIRQAPGHDTGPTPLTRAARGWTSIDMTKILLQKKEVGGQEGFEDYRGLEMVLEGPMQRRYDHQAISQAKIALRLKEDADAAVRARRLALGFGVAYLERIWLSSFLAPWRQGLREKELDRWGNNLLADYVKHYTQDPRSNQAVQESTRVIALEEPGGLPFYHSR